MCSIYGALGMVVDPRILGSISERAKDRGRDGGGLRKYELGGEKIAWLGNWRATPTPEVEKAPFQPYDGVVHNGTIANAEELGLRPGEVDSMVLPRVLDDRSLLSFRDSVLRIKGSYALAKLSKTNSTIYAAVNYKPLHVWSSGGAVYFSSMERHFDGLLPPHQRPVAVKPYTVCDLETMERHPIPREDDGSVVVVASAGLDSTVVATKLVREGRRVRLLHFRYGCRAETREVDCIRRIADYLHCECAFIDLPFQKFAGASNLLDETSRIAGPIEGAEYAVEWVPARNLVFFSLAVAYAESNGFHGVALGNNLEESSAFPDNEEQFFEILRYATEYATQNGYYVNVLQPCGNLMKHEIVALGLKLSAPLHLTWSCYRAGERHCSCCGPDFMRMEAFKRNGVIDPAFDWNSNSDYWKGCQRYGV